MRTLFLVTLLVAIFGLGPVVRVAGVLAALPIVQLVMR